MHRQLFLVILLALSAIACNEPCMASTCLLVSDFPYQKSDYYQYGISSLTDCQNACTGSGYKYSGVTGKTCMCGNSLSPNMVIQPSSKCTARCAQSTINEPCGDSTNTYVTMLQSTPCGNVKFGVCGYPNSFAQIQAAGIKNVRMDLPDANTITTARTYGIEILPIACYGYLDLSGTNDWHAPPLPQNRATWAKRMVNTWRTMANPPKVIEVWNEPWMAHFWPPRPNPKDYLELVKAFAAEAWAVWPTVTLLVSGDTGSGDYSNWRKHLLGNDTTGILRDPRILPTTHNYVEKRTPYSITPQPCMWDLDRYECAYNDWKTHGHPNPQVWVTEYGWETNTPSPSVSSNNVPVYEQQQSDFTVGAFNRMINSKKVAAVYSFMFGINQNWSYNWLRPDNSNKPIVAAVKNFFTAANLL